MSARPPLRDQAIPLLGLIAAAVAIRAILFGDPVIHIDEQFYLLAGDRLWWGALPFVDIWDRKPVGLFLLYAAIRAPGGDGIIAYQLVATAFAAATACVIARLAQRIATPAAGWVAGLLYLLLLMTNGGEGGQAPVFYNLPVALAALLLAAIVARPGFDRRATALGCAAMALIGIAIQIKYTALFEGMYFGIALIVIAWRRGVAAGRIVLLAATWAAIAIAPTALAFAAYAAAGHADAFVFANFVSIFLRPASDGAAGIRALRIAIHVAPVAIPALVALATARMRPNGDGVRLVLTGWMLTAVAAVAGFGSYFDHYALPLLAPLAVAGAPALALPRAGRWIAALALLAATILAVTTIADHIVTRGTGAAQRAIAGYIRPRLTGRLYVFSGDPVLYLLTGAPLPGRWPFPPHLSERRDRFALGVDPIAELNRIMASRPQFVVTRDPGSFPPADLPSFALVNRHLRRDYRLAMARRAGNRVILLYRRTAA